MAPIFSSPARRSSTLFGFSHLAILCCVLLMTMASPASFSAGMIQFAHATAEAVNQNEAQSENLYVTATSTNNQRRRASLGGKSPRGGAHAVTDELRIKYLGQSSAKRLEQMAKLGAIGDEETLSAEDEEKQTEKDSAAVNGVSKRTNRRSFLGSSSLSLGSSGAYDNTDNSAASSSSTDLFVSALREGHRVGAKINRFANSFTSHLWRAVEAEGGAGTGVSAILNMVTRSTLEQLQSWSDAYFASSPFHSRPKRSLSLDRRGHSAKGSDDGEVETTREDGFGGEEEENGDVFIGKVLGEYLHANGGLAANFFSQGVLKLDAQQEFDQQATLQMAALRHLGQRLGEEQARQIRLIALEVAKKRFESSIPSILALSTPEGAIVSPYEEAPSPLSSLSQQRRQSPYKPASIGGGGGGSGSSGVVFVDGDALKRGFAANREEAARTLFPNIADMMFGEQSMNRGDEFGFPRNGNNGGDSTAFLASLQNASRHAFVSSSAAVGGISSKIGDASDAGYIKSNRGARTHSSSSSRSSFTPEKTRGTQRNHIPAGQLKANGRVGYDAQAVKDRLSRPSFYTYSPSSPAALLYAQLYSGPGSPSSKSSSSNNPSSSPSSVPNSKFEGIYRPPKELVDAAVAQHLASIESQQQREEEALVKLGHTNGENKELNGRREMGTTNSARGESAHKKTRYFSGFEMKKGSASGKRDGRMTTGVAQKRKSKEDLATEAFLLSEVDQRSSEGEGRRHRGVLKSLSTSTTDVSPSALVVLNPPLFASAFSDVLPSEGDDVSSSSSAEPLISEGRSARRSSSSSSFSAQDYYAGLGVRYIKIFSNPRKFCGEGLMVIPDDGDIGRFNDSREILMCQAFNNYTAAPFPTANPDDPSEPNEQGLTERDYLSRYSAMISIRQPFTVGDYKYRMTDAQRRTCMISTSAIDCVCATDAQRVANGFGQQLCVMKAIQCDFEVLSPNQTCAPPSEVKATPQIIQPGCFRASRADPSYKMSFSPRCSQRSLNKAEFDTLGYRLLPSDRLASTPENQPLLVLGRWRADTSYVRALPEPYFDAALNATIRPTPTAEQLNFTTGLVTSPYLSLSENETFFEYIGDGPSVSNTVNLTATNDIFEDSSFVYFRQLYNFHAISDPSALTELRMTNATNRTEISMLFNSKNIINVDFNLASLSDEYYTGGRAYGEVGFQGVQVTSSAINFFLDMDYMPPGTYTPPKTSFNAALLALIVFVVLLAIAGSVYWYRNFREKRRAERDRKIAEEKGNLLWGE